MMNMKPHGIVVVALLIVQIGCAKRDLVPPGKAGAKNPITEEEINAHKGRSNLLLYTVGGGALSFGISFFLGSLVERASHDGNQALYFITAGGTLLGTGFFAYLGSKRDRLAAIEKVKELQRKQMLIKLRQKKEKIKKELERVKQEQEQLEAEKKRLLEKLQKQEKHQ